MNNKTVKMSLPVLLIAGMLAVPANAQQAMNMEDLLRAVERGQVQDNKENKAREARFREARAEQDRLLREARAEKAAQERRSEKLEAEAEKNKEKLFVMEAQLNVKLGSLKELFGVMQQVAGDARTRFDTSLTSVQYPDRVVFLENLAKKIGSSAQLPSLDEIEKLWFELHREMTESGKVVKFNTPVMTVDGLETPMDVVRVGLFNIVSDGKYLRYENGDLEELPRQPEAGRFTGSTSDLLSASGGMVRFGLDPTKGGVLKTYVARPNIIERIQQGGLVGYLIIALGIVGLLISLERMIVLGSANKKVSKQLESSTPSDDNALGRVLGVYAKLKTTDTETLELKLSEAIFKETPALNRALLFIKIISVVAPLMGLLGTVTGMINTFQAITLYGTGDPKLMAGGISQALVTTVLGLSVAIPMVLLHTIVSGRSKRIVQVLQEQSAGIIAEHAEKNAAG
ncbi:MAG: energy transducer TonB [Gammaproteobacteria bacterium]|nr:energy transducer TonB [Gammaproteobacteria bacterium]MCP4090548.1 energy transducer TonB [Gammaproteobacteria bacterium]MCP4276587.1 energy transducer TonB [Gammaproteobacteria bacterium]MCP4831347.1 energy transducer TonB [Gammaproteobacteria bacterium]MCP4928721.1 energy transducer TonB [Gammaproteobacteria bacterium]